MANAKREFVPLAWTELARSSYLAMPNVKTAHSVVSGKRFVYSFALTYLFALL